MVGAHNAAITAFLLTSEGCEEQRKLNMRFATKGLETVTEGWRSSTLKQTANEYDLSLYWLLPVSDSESEEHFSESKLQEKIGKSRNQIALVSV